MFTVATVGEIEKANQLFSARPVLVLQGRLIRWRKMDPVYDKWVRHSPLLGRATPTTQRQLISK